MYCVHSIFSLFTFFHLLETWELNSNGINKHIPQYLLCLEDCIFWAHKYLNTGHHQLGQNYHINVARKKSVKPSITFLTCLVIGAFYHMMFLFQFLDMLFVSVPLSLKEWGRSLQCMCTEVLHFHWHTQAQPLMPWLKPLITEFILILSCQTRKVTKDYVCGENRRKE